ncbi:hypothetical protein [Pseudomonas sp. TE3610]
MSAQDEINEPGDLDPSFGLGAIVSLDHLAGPSRCQGMQLAGDGGVLVLSDNPDEGYWLSKFTAQGALDTRFAKGDGALFDGTLRSRNAALHLWDDRPTVIAAQASQLMIKRYQPDGLPDPGFGQDGAVYVPLGDLIPAFSGKLTTVRHDSYWYVAFAAKWQGSNTHLLTVVLRLDQDGGLDAGFNQTGFTVIDLAGQEPIWNMPVDLKVQQHGSNKGKLLVLVERRFTPTDRHDNFVVRLNEDGTRDFPFGPQGDGLVALAYADFAKTNRLVLDAADTFKVLGVRSNGDCAGLGFTLDGSVDPGFNSGALWLTPVGVSQHKTGWCSGISWGDQGSYRLLTWGLYSDRFMAHQFQISRVNQRCEPDTDFGDDGNSAFDCRLGQGFGEGRPATVRSPQGDYYLCYSDKVIKVLG